MVAKVNAASVPRSERILGRADCLSTDAVGNVVRIRADKVGNRFQVEKVDISTIGNPPGVAVLVKKYSATDCIVQFHGPLRTIYPSLSYAQAYLVGTDSLPAKQGDANYPIDGIHYFQQMGVSTSGDEILINFLDATFGGLGGGSVRFFQQTLVATIDPTIFTVAMPFKHGGVETEIVSYNGQRLIEGAGNDYVASESGGAGTGYDTIILEFIPRSGSNFKIDYNPAV